VLLVTVADDEDEETSSSLWPLLKAAGEIVQAWKWPCAQVTVVRTFVPPHQSRSVRRIQFDERALQACLLPNQHHALDGLPEVIHVPHRQATAEFAEACRGVERCALAGLATRLIRVPQQVSPKVTETEWLHALIFVFNETRMQSFLEAAEEETFWFSKS
jgi:hypothetical protein